MLYPINTPSRMVFDLNGVWQFSLRRPGEPDDGPLQDPRPMPVPAAYNDIYPDAALRTTWERRRMSGPSP
jgi:beta-glucuronidase